MTKPIKSMEQIIRDDGRYPPEAFGFLHDGLGKAVDAAHGSSGKAAAGKRHVSGRQLCEALRDLAIERWGLLARTVLERWNVRATLDFGHMVYLLVREGYMRKTDEDSLDDFRDVYDFSQAFDAKYEFSMKA
jgi:uncharacterized repeat protein (TIGR04138 family)